MLAFGLAFFACLLVIRIANKYAIYDKPTSIKIHKKVVTFLGSVAILVGFFIPVVFAATKFHIGNVLLYELALLFLISIYGVYDDFVILNSYRKLIFFVVVSFILCLIVENPEAIKYQNLNFRNLASMVSRVVIYCIVINAFNLIDGADGVLATISIVSVMAYISIFSQLHLIFETLAGLTLIGCLFAYLIFNFTPASIFMGDGGSLFIGLYFAICTHNILSLSNSAFPFGEGDDLLLIKSASLVALPIFDLFRVFIIRIYRRANPLKGDRNHIHHLFQRIGFSCKQVIVAVLLIHIVFISIAFVNVFHTLYGYILFISSLYALITIIIAELEAKLNFSK